MKINFKQPKYILPLIVLPFLCLFFYVWHSSRAKRQAKALPQSGIQDNIGDVSPEVRNQSLTDKLDAFRNTYKESDGYTAVSPIRADSVATAAAGSPYNAAEKRMLDSINRRMRRQFREPGGATRTTPYTDGRSFALRHKPSALSGEDQALAAALSHLARPERRPQVNQVSENSAAPREKDPMELFKSQMAYMDSMSKAGDPQYQAERQRQAAIAKAEALRKSKPSLSVRKSLDAPGEFNTVLPPQKEAFITAMIDENVTGFAGSRVRLRLLDDLYAGRFLVKKGTSLYALVSGFQGQRILLSVQSVLTGNQILPVRLEVYDQDGLPGLYVPASAFRELTKDLGGTSMQGVTIDGGAQSGSQFLMSTAGKMFQSVSSALASAIRKNKAKIKFGAYIYLIDPQAQQQVLSNP